MQLLQDIFIVENLQVMNEGTNKDTMRIRGVFGRCNEKNNNGRIYPTTVLEGQLKKMQPLIQERRLCGELDHPSNDTVKLSNASHLITKLEIKGNELIGEAEILKTPAGLTAKALIDGGVRIGISSRGMGTLSEDAQGNKVVNEDYRLVTFDLVADPSTRGAFPTLAESTQSRFVRESQGKLQKESNFVTMLKSKLRTAYEPILEEKMPKKIKKSTNTCGTISFRKIREGLNSIKEGSINRKIDDTFLETFSASEVDKEVGASRERKKRELRREEMMAALKKRDLRQDPQRPKVNLNDPKPTGLNADTLYEKIGRSILLEISPLDTAIDRFEADRQVRGDALRRQQDDEVAQRMKNAAGQSVSPFSTRDQGGWWSNYRAQQHARNMAKAEAESQVERDRILRAGALRAQNPKGLAGRAGERLGGLLRAPGEFAKAFGQGRRGQGWDYGDTTNAPFPIGSAGAGGANAGANTAAAPNTTTSTPKPAELGGPAPTNRQLPPPPPDNKDEPDSGDSRTSRPDVLPKEPGSSRENVQRAAASLGGTSSAKPPTLAGLTSFPPSPQAMSGLGSRYGFNPNPNEPKAPPTTYGQQGNVNRPPKQNASTGRRR